VHLGVCRSGGGDMTENLHLTLSIDGVQYKLLDYLGWQASAGMYAAEVETETGPRKVVTPKRGGQWRFWTVKDRVP
jgi:hypothetical protein